MVQSLLILFVIFIIFFQNVVIEQVVGVWETDAWLEFNMPLHPGNRKELNRVLHNLVLKLWK
jgi:uncharacterized membrane protein